MSVAISAVTLSPTKTRKLFSRRAPITITNGSGGALTNYQVKIAVTYDAQMAADFSDLRFSNASGRARYRYWIESKTDSTSATVWVRVPSVPAGTSTIYMYYGGTNVAAGSSGKATFRFFEDTWSDLVESTVLTGHTKLTIPDPDASGEAIHPSVVYFANGWGYGTKKYWMGFTPYKDMAAAKENPSIISSDDGITWAVPTGVTNPLVAKADEGHNCDSQLVYNDDTGELYFYWVRSDDSASPVTRLCVMKSSNGVNWTNRTGTAIASMNDAAWRADAVVGPLAAADREWSPCVIKKATGDWRYWACTEGGLLVYRTSADGFTWSDPTTCDDGTTTNLWHIGVIWSSTLSKFLMLSIDTANYQVLRLSESTDGTTWTRLPWPVLNSSSTLTDWDSILYRSVMVEIGANVTVFTSCYQTGSGADAWIGRCTPMSVTDFYNAASGTLKNELANVVYRTVDSAAHGGAATVSNGVLTLTPLLDGTSQNGIYARAGSFTATNNVAVRARMKPSHSGYASVGLCGGKQIYDGTYAALANAGPGAGYRIVQWTDGKMYEQIANDTTFAFTDLHASAALTTTDAFHIWELVVFSTGQVRGFLDNVAKTNITGQTEYLANAKWPWIANGVQGSGTARACDYDWLLVRECVPTEPTSSVGSEESGSYRVSA